MLFVLSPLNYTVHSKAVRCLYIYLLLHVVDISDGMEFPTLRVSGHMGVGCTPDSRAVGLDHLKQLASSRCCFED